jgi:hypothetical protein
LSNAYIAYNLPISKEEMDKFMLFLEEETDSEEQIDKDLDLIVIKLEKTYKKSKFLLFTGFIYFFILLCHDNTFT